MQHKMRVFAGYVLCCMCLGLSLAQVLQMEAHAHLPVTPTLSVDTNHTTARATAANSVPYFRASIPMRIYECLRNSSFLRCIKLFVLQKMEERKQYVHSNNLTKDFLDQFFGEETQIGSLTSQKYLQMTEKDLNQRLGQNFHRFFKHRDIKLHFLPGILIKIVPSNDNKLKFMLKKALKTRMGRIRRRDTEEMQYNLINMPPMGGASSASVEAYEPEAEGDTKQGIIGGGGVPGDHEDGAHALMSKRKQHKKPTYKTTMLQMAVPILIMPAILLGSVIPFLLPALKMATLMSMMMNNGAFIAALLYAARTYVNAQEEQHISYGHVSGYH